VDVFGTQCNVMKHIPRDIIVKLLISKGYHILFHFC